MYKYTMKNNTCKISIVTVCFNAEQIIEQTIKSVIGQTYPNLQYIIIDGRSTDKTMEIVQKYRQYIDTIISEPDKGIFDAMNKSLKYVKGEFVNFMNAGDVFCNSDILTTVFDKKYEDNIGFIFGTYFTADGLEKKHLPFVRNKLKYKGMGICHQAIFVKSELAKKYRFRYDLPVSADYGMIYDIYNDGFDYSELDYPICIYEGGGFSTQKPWLMVKDVAKITKSTFTYKYISLMFKYRLRYYAKIVLSPLFKKR